MLERRWMCNRGCSSSTRFQAPALIDIRMKDVFWTTDCKCWMEAICYTGSKALIRWRYRISCSCERLFWWRGLSAFGWRMCCCCCRCQCCVLWGCNLHIRVIFQVTWLCFDNTTAWFTSGCLALYFDPYSSYILGWNWRNWIIWTPFVFIMIRKWMIWTLFVFIMMRKWMIWTSYVFIRILANYVFCVWRVLLPAVYVISNNCGEGASYFELNWTVVMSRCLKGSILSQNESFHCKANAGVKRNCL